LDQLDQKYSFLVIGDGPERTLIEAFKNKNPHFPLKLLGSLSRSEVLERFESISILVNCAPSEGYGLAMREALASGSSVIALSNEGTRELQESFPAMVHLFNDADEACNLIQALYGKSPDLDLIKAYRIRQRDLNDFGMDLLVKSWF
jgi:glycosyltransferase involved in cell wall biosynthesis